LFASLKGVKIVRDDNEEDYSEIYIDLKAEADEDIVTIYIDELAQGTYIKLTELVFGGLTLLASFDSDYHKKIEEYKKRIESYNYSVVQIRDTPIDTATEIFTRINVGGKPLTLFEIMVAKTYDTNRNFDLSEKYQELIENLRPLNYDTLSDSTVLQTIAIILSNECTKKQILRLNKTEFIDTWDNVISAIESAVEYFKFSYRIPVSQLLPYNALIVVFAYFFFKHNDKPDELQKKYLQDLFWRISLTGRYSSGVEGKIAQDIKKIDLILEGKQPKYEWSVNISKEFISNNGWFSAGRSFVKAILCLFTYHQPKSFNDDSLVNISNDWLKQANSKNYHHFFPRSYLAKKGCEMFLINHIVNITIVDDFLNKRLIKDKAPSRYMEDFIKGNKEIGKTMKTHLINNLAEFGVLNDDYDLFFDRRLTVISKELKNRIIEQAIDKENILESLPEEF
jgi:hypothetical protein